ncbi:MAG: DUF4097 family beta strand repeat-containing protein [Gemmatimonadales bacterium]
MNGKREAASGKRSARRPLGLACTLAIAAAVVPSTAAAQADFTWTGRVAAGKTVEIKGVNGGITAMAASGNEVEVTARKRSRDDDPEDVKIEVIEHEGGVTVCAVYPTPRRARRENRCEIGHHWSSSTDDTDVVVDFTVRIPAGLHLDAHTVNGDVEAMGLGGNVDAGTVNGGVEVTTTGWVEANTVNGSIRATMGRADWTGELEFQTVNGGITLQLPATLNTEVRAQTVNGDLASDYPLTVSGRWGPRHLKGTIGSGGRELSLNTVNGGIKLRKST